MVRREREAKGRDLQTGLASDLPGVTEEGQTGRSQSSLPFWSRPGQVGLALNKVRRTFSWIGEVDFHIPVVLNHWLSALEEEG